MEVATKEARAAISYGYVEDIEALGTMEDEGEEETLNGTKKPRVEWGAWDETSSKRPKVP